MLEHTTVLAGDIAILLIIGVLVGIIFLGIIVVSFVFAIICMSKISGLNRRIYQLEQLLAAKHQQNPHQNFNNINPANNYQQNNNDLNL